MAQSIKLGNNTFLDWTGVTVDSSGTNLSNALRGDTIIKTKQFSSSSFTVAARTSGSIQYNITEPGYTPIGIVMIYGSGTAGLAYSDWYINGTTEADVYYCNTTDSAKTVNRVTIVVLYRKS